MTDRIMPGIFVGARCIVAFALSVAFFVATSADAQCGGGGISTDPIPFKQVLRSYRADFAAPVRLALDEAGNVFVADPGAGKIVVRAPDGHLLDVITGLGNPISVAAGAAGVYVGDGKAGSVRVFARDFRSSHYLGQGRGEFVRPADIGVDAASGKVWVLDTAAHHVKIFDPSGDLIRTVGTRGAEEGNFAAPTGLVVDQVRSRVVIADQLNARLQIFDLTGDYVTCIGSRGGLPGEFIMPQAVWIDPDGRFYVADSFEGRVQILDPQGNFIDYIGDIGDALGHVRHPGDLLMDPAGRLFVASTGSARLEVFGVGAFSDPETTIPVVASVSPDPFRPRSSPFVEVAIEIPGYDLGQIDVATFRLNGVAAIYGSVVQGDPDGDGIPDLIGRFDTAATAATLPLNGTVEVDVRAMLGTMQVEGFAELTVLGGTDADRDRVPDDLDVCPGSMPSALTDAVGCSVEQRCPCGGPVARAKWRSRSQYVRCVVRESLPFVESGVMTADERSRLIQRAGSSGCGAPRVERPVNSGVTVERRIR